MRDGASSDPWIPWKEEASMRGRRAIAGVLAVGLGFATGCGAIKRCAYSGPGRDAWQQPERVVAELEIRGGEQVADLGAGGGYFTFRLADAVGSEGMVYAVDVDPEMVAYLRKRAEEEARANVVPVLAAFDDPKLPEAVDLIFSTNTYHHLEDRSAYFEQAAGDLRPGGRIAIIEFSGVGFFHRLFGGHSTPASVIRSEMEAAGYREVERHDFLSRQNFLIFSRAEE
jgi:predicted methyltransferase